MTTTTDSQAKIVVPASLDMVSLLGSGDEHVRALERGFPSLDVLVRGNEITLTGPAPEVALADRVIGEMLAVLRTGQGLTPEGVERTVATTRACVPPTC
jgi:phosphate starvation-inducible PhoH-like protein